MQTVLATHACVARTDYGIASIYLARLNLLVLYSSYSLPGAAK
jgi:hypothetical protein